MRSGLSVLLLAAACSVPGVDLGSKGCPCIEGFRCILATNECVAEGSVGLVPSNVGDESLFHEGEAEVIVPAPERWVIDTTALGVTAFGASGTERVEAADVPLREVAQDGGPALAVWIVDRLVVEDGAELIGVGRRPLVVLARGEVVVGGLVSVGADRLPGERHAGAGGYTGAEASHRDGYGPGAGSNGIADGSVEPCAGGDACDVTECVDVTGGGGGGGAGHGTDGGRGGAGARDTGEPGLVYGEPTLVPLAGGSGGGAGGSGPGSGCSGQPTGGEGGHGGGALQISAAVSVTVRGTLDARGGGGRGGRLPERSDFAPDYHWGAGGGGGSGGAILIEAPRVVVEGQVAANGGAGGDPAVGDEPGADGEPGVAGGVARSPGVGGDGNDGDTPGTDGGNVGNPGGGGGGGAGRIRIQTADGATFSRGVGAVATFGTIRAPGR